MSSPTFAERFLTQSELLAVARRHYSNYGVWPKIPDLERLTGARAARIKQVAEGLLSANLAAFTESGRLRLTGDELHGRVVTYKFTPEQLAAGPPYPTREEILAPVPDKTEVSQMGKPRPAALPSPEQLLVDVAAVKAAGVHRYIVVLTQKYGLPRKVVSEAIYRARKHLGVDPPSSPSAAESETKPEEIIMPHQASSPAAAEPESELSKSLVAIKAVADRHCPPEITSTVEEFISPNLCDRCVKWDVCPMANYYADQVSPSPEELPPSLSNGRMVFGARPLLECDWFVDSARVS